MKTILTVILSMFLAGNAMANLPGSLGDVHEEVVSVSDVYVPSGFDTGSDAFIIVNGFFNNGCYSWKDAVVTEKSATTHEIKVTATVRAGLCTMALQPYTKEVRLGQLVAGTHTLRFDNGDGTYFEKRFEVE